MAHHEIHGEAGERLDHGHIEMPAPTYWPVVFAFGLLLLFGGLVTHWVISLVGLVVALTGIIQWWHDVIPHEEHEAVPIDPAHRPAPIMVEQRSVMKLDVGEAHHRAHVPERIRPYSAGIWGGLVGGAVMAALACLYGLVIEHSIWYPINLLAGVVIPGIGRESVEQLRHFSAFAFLAALVGHIVISILVGILYAVTLPMFPQYAPFWAGIVMPIFWTGIIATVLNILNPALNSRISWPWFIVSQLGFGLVGGYVIARSTQIDTMQSLHFAQRASVHGGGLGHTAKDEDQ
jgi:hypothetical protein